MRLTRIIFIVVFIKLSTFYVVAGQTPRKIDKDKVFNPERLSVGNITINASDEQPPVSLPQFGKIEVIDVRTDNMAGFHQRAIGGNKWFQFDGGLEQQANNYFKKTTILSTDTSSPTLVLFIKEVWLNEHGFDEDDKDKVYDDIGSRRNESLMTIDTYQFTWSQTSLTLNIDGFIKNNDGYYAAIRFDTTISKLLKAPRFAKTYFDFALTLLLLRLEKIAPSTVIPQKTKRSFNEVASHYREYKQLPVLADTVLQKGVYLTFDEFKANKPSVREFELKKGKLADVLYLGSGPNGTLPTREAWGYCDGEYVFMKAGENYYPLVRHQDSFYLLGSTEIQRIGRYPEPSPYYDNMGGMPATPRDRVKYANKLFPYKLNWQTGKPY